MEEPASKKRKLGGYETEDGLIVRSNIDSDGNVETGPKPEQIEPTINNVSDPKLGLKDITTQVSNCSDATTTPKNSTIGPTLSKTQQKKLRKQLEWESKRPERKAIRKQKQVEKRQRRKAAREAEQQHEQDQGQNDSTTTPITPFKRPKGAQLPVTILIDCAYDDLMTDGERTSLGTQITRCYSTNRAARFRTHLGVCSFNGKLRERFDSKLDHYRGWKGVHFVGSDFVETAEEQAMGWMRDEKYGGKLAGLFSTFSNNQNGRIEDDQTRDQTGSEEQIARLQSEAEIIYLSSEAAETLHTLRPYSTYIIGGLVDKNREKGICHARATARGVKTARLPIGEFLDLTSRRVLATNHVFEIILKFLEDGDWGSAFMGVIPKRKGGKLRNGSNEGIDGDGDRKEEVEEEEDDDDDGSDEGDERNGEEVEDYKTEQSDTNAETL